MRQALVVVVGLLAGCVQDNTLVCGDERCPASSVCTPRGCATPADVEACRGLPEGTGCGVDDPAVCRDGFCERAVCGDRVAELGEACDDGNRTSGDGCSERCDSTEQCGNGVVDVGVGEQCDEGIAALSSDGCTSQCTVEFASWEIASPRVIAPRAGHAMVGRADGSVLLHGGSGANDTWRWTEASGWEYEASRQVPPARTASALVFDPVRDRTFLFAGRSDQTDLGDVWAFDRAGWRQLAPSAPGPRGAVVAAFDPTAAVTVVLAADGTWRFDGATWEPPAVPSPAGRTEAVMHFVPSVGGIVLFSGVAIEDEVPRADAWVYRDARWTQLPTPAPRERRGAASTVTADGRLLLVGGSMRGLSYADAWLFGADGWTALENLPAGLVPRTGAAMARGVSSTEIVLFGGTQSLSFTDSTFTAGPPLVFTSRETTVLPSVACTGSIGSYPTRGEIVLVSPYGGRTYTWRGEAWSTRAEPFYGCGPVVVYDPRRDRLLGVGAGDVGSAWDGTSWTPLPSGPPQRAEAAVAYDPIQRRLVHFGGRRFGGAPGTSALSDETWADGIEQPWSQLAVDGAPAPRQGHALAFDATVGRMVLHGGRSESGAVNDTWELDGLGWRPLTIAEPLPPPGTRVLMTTGVRGRPLLVVLGTATSTWELQRSPTSARWVELGTVRAPPTLATPSLAFDVARREAVLVGTAGSGLQTWSFAYTSPEVPAERCLATGVDADSDDDGAVGCADPDCAGICDPLCRPYDATPCAADRARCGDAACSLVEDYETCPEDCALP